MSLNNDQFHVVRRDTPSRHGQGDGDSIDTEWGVIHTPESGKPSLVGYTNYEGGWWNTPRTYDRAFERAEVGEDVPMFRRIDDIGVQNMAVHPDFQGRGLGKLLANHVAEEHWRRNPKETGAIPPHTSLSSASDGMISHLTGDDPASVGEHWDDNPDYGQLGLYEEDFTDEETGEVDYEAMANEADSLTEDWADQERNSFARSTLYRNSDINQSVSDHIAARRSMAPGTPIRDTGSPSRWSQMRVAPPTERSIDENSEITQRVMHYGLPPFEEPKAPEQPAPRPFRNGQMRLPGTYERRLP